MVNFAIILSKKKIPAKMINFYKKYLIVQEKQIKAIKHNLNSVPFYNLASIQIDQIYQ
jgi:hypothetical protein